MLRVSDPDSSPDELVFSSMGNLNTDAGYLEHQDYPGRLVLEDGLYQCIQIRGAREKSSKAEKGKHEK